MAPRKENILDNVMLLWYKRRRLTKCERRASGAIRPPFFVPLSAARRPRAGEDPRPPSPLVSAPPVFLDIRPREHDG
jgi:hypothetical protein